MSDVHCSNCRGSLFQTSLILPTADDEARLVALLRTNHPPVDPLHVVVGWLQQGHTELDRYNVEITQRQTSLQKLIDERERISTQLKRYHTAYFSPIRRLPGELLVEIIYHTLLASDSHGNPFMDNAAKRLAQKPLLVLAEVCHRWHEAIFNTPKLWSNLNVILGHRTPGRYAHLLERTLARSGQFPLSIQLFDGQHAHRHGIDPELVQLLLPHVPRWRSLHVDVDESASTLRLIASSGLETLETIHLSLRQAHTFTTWNPISAPCLRVASFVSYRPLELPPLPWSQIESFSCDALEPFAPRDLIAIPWQQFPSGASLSLNVPRFTDAWTQSLPAMTSQIGQFTLTVTRQAGLDFARDSLGAVFRAFTMPHLYSLRLRSPEDYLPPRFTITPFRAFVKRSNLATSLTVLELNVVMSDLELLSVLTSLPSLEDLSLYDPSPDDHGTVSLIQDSLLRTLQRSSGPEAEASSALRPFLVPKLRRLSLRTVVAFSDAAILDLIAFRCSTVKIFELHIRRFGPPLRDTLETEFWVTVDGWIEKGSLKLTYTEEI